MAPRGHWLSTERDKAWSELVMLAYTPVWIGAVGLVMLTGWIHTWSDLGYLAFSIAIGAPALLGPALLHHRGGGRRPWWRSYWLKLNLWSAVLVAGGTYFGTHYFFDLMGMRYGFPVTWTFESPIVGRRGGTVPVFMYPLTQAYFVSYFAGLTVAYRYLRTRYRLGRLGRAIAVVGLAYAIAFAETLTMANPAISEYFAYEDRSRMLALGSFGYAIYFVVGLPMAFAIDEPTPDDPSPDWPLRKVLLHALAAYMIILCGLEAWAQIIGPL